LRSSVQYLQACPGNIRRCPARPGINKPHR
jgi:hypothetical protein